MNREQFDCYLDGVELMLGETMSVAQFKAIVEEFDRVLNTEIAHAVEMATVNVVAPAVDIESRSDEYQWAEVRAAAPVVAAIDEAVNAAQPVKISTVIDAPHMSDADFAALNAQLDPVIDLSYPPDPANPIGEMASQYIPAVA